MPYSCMVLLCEKKYFRMRNVVNLFVNYLAVSCFQALTMKTRLDLNLLRYTCICLQSVGIKSVCTMTFDFFLASVLGRFMST